MIICTAKNFIKKDKLKEFQKIAKKLIDKSQQEKGCIEYQVYKDKDDETIFCFIEKWQSLKALESHFQTKHFKELVAKLEKLKYKKDEVNIYKEV